MKAFQLLAMFIFVSLCSCKPNLGETIRSIDDKGTHLEITVLDGKYLIKPYNTKIVETTFVPNGEEYKSSSHAVILNPEKNETKLKYNEETIEYSTSGISVTVNKEPFHISYSYQGQSIISEKDGYSKNKNSESIQFRIDSTEVLYGGGARALGMNRRGNRLQLYNKAHYGYESSSELMNYTMPIVISSKKYMLHFDNAPIGYLDLDSKKDNTLTYETISGRKTYQVIVGDSWFDLIDNYTDLTGKQPMPPRWALGNFSSRFGYHSEKETRNAIDAFKNEEIPVDAVILDLYWFGKDIQGHLGNFGIYKDSFPNAKKMIKDFNAKGVKTIFITEPFVLTTSKRWQEAVDKEVLALDSIGNPYIYDFYFGNTGLIDIYNPKGKEWFWNIYKDIANLGVAGVWGDLGEPEVHPSKLIHATGTADEVHNIYGHDWAKLVYEGYQKDFPGQRPFILMRAGYSGSQRFGLIPWSGDVNRSWGGLQSQTEIALQMGMQGLGYMHSDLGGFAGANLDDELYTRWLQYGVFQPIYRPHAQEEVPSEPVFREPKTKALAKESIELRYRLLPYNYSLVFENNQTGAPLMRPLFFEDDKDTVLLTNRSTYLWGNDFLVTPIVHPAVKEKEVYFPKGSVWFDFYTNNRIEGGQSKFIKTKENSIPTFIRAGAFIPMAEPMQNTTEYMSDKIELHYYHDISISASNGLLYNDNGSTPFSFEKGAYEIINFESEVSEKELQIDFSSKIGSNFSSTNKQMDIVVHNIHNNPKKVLFDGQEIDFKLNNISKTLKVMVMYDTSTRKTLNVKL